MSGKAEQNDNGGSLPAEMNTEFRDDSRHSVPLSPETKMNGDGENEEPDDSPQPGAKMTREELESKFRNDPRFTMLFDHGKDKDKKATAHYPKVGGIRLTPKRILILSGFFLVILACLMSCLYFLFSDISRHRNYSRAAKLFEAGDYEAAKDLFVKVINDDPNKEEAVVALAEIYHHNGDWNNETFFRQRLMRLNPLKPELFDDFLNSAFRARNFGVIYSHLNLKVLEEEELSPLNGALYVIAALHTRHEAEAKEFYEAQRVKNPDYFSETEHGRFAEILLNSARMNKEQAKSLSSFLDGFKDPQVRFETINLILIFLSDNGDKESEAKTEELLQKASELNNFAGAPLLANYYFTKYRFDDAIKVCEDFLKTKANAFMPLLYAESCALSDRYDLIPPLSEKMHNLMGRQSRILFSYMDALTAFHDGDNAKLRRLLLEAGATIETPLSSLMKLQVALSADSPKEVRVMLQSIINGRPFLDFPQRARTAALYYLMEKTDGDILSDPELLNDCAEIALLIQSPGDDNSFLQRIILLDRFTRNVLREEDLLGALRTFPGDIVLLRIAIEYYLAHSQPMLALDRIADYNALNIPGKPSVAVLHVRALALMGRKEEAEKEFRALVEQENADDALLSLYYDFCVENHFLDSLEFLADWIEKTPAISGKRDVIPFIRAEILLADGKNDEALALFEKSKAKDPRFIFHAAARLAEAGRTDAAIARYLSIMDTYPDKARLCLRLSDIYSAKGDAEKASAYAETAWKNAPGDQQVQYAYGKLLFDAGRYADVLSVLKFPQYRAIFPDNILKLWSDAIRAQIKFDLNTGRYLPAQENVKHLLIYFPDDEWARDTLKTIEEMRRKEKNGG